MKRSPPSWRAFSCAIDNDALPIKHDAVRLNRLAHVPSIHHPGVSLRVLDAAARRRPVDGSSAAQNPECALGCGRLVAALVCNLFAVNGAKYFGRVERTAEAR